MRVKLTRAAAVADEAGEWGKGKREERLKRAEAVHLKRNVLLEAIKAAVVTSRQIVIAIDNLSTRANTELAKAGRGSPN